MPRQRCRWLKNILIRIGNFSMQSDTYKLIFLFKRVVYKKLFNFLFLFRIKLNIGQNRPEKSLYPGREGGKVSTAFSKYKHVWVSQRAHACVGVCLWVCSRWNFILETIFTTFWWAWDITGVEEAGPPCPGIDDWMVTGCGRSVSKKARG